MDLHLPLYWIPNTITVFIVLLFLFWPTPSPRGDYDFGGQIEIIFQFFAAIVSILIVWLVYALAT